MKLIRLAPAALLLFILTFSAMPLVAVCYGSGEAAQLLRESYQTARGLSPEDRLDFLISLTRAAAKISHEDTAKWAKELFDLASDPGINVSDWDRLAAKKNALIALAYVSPQEVFQSKYFPSIASQPHPANTKHRFPEDLRADSAILIFPILGHKSVFLRDITEQAKQIGATGEYPYRAVGRLIEELGKTDSPNARNEALSLFGDATRFYPPKLPFTNANQEFLALLNSAQHNVPSQIYEEGLKAFVAQVTSRESQPADKTYVADVYTANQVYRFTDRNRYLLFRVLPLIAQVDESWAQHLKKDHSELNSANDEIQHIEQGVINGYPTQELQARLEHQMQLGATLARIQHLQQDNPWGALELAKGILAPADRMVGLSYVVPGIVNVDPGQARKIYSQELQLMDGVEETTRLSSSIILAKTAYYLNDLNTFTDSTLKAFQDGATQFDNDAKFDNGDKKRAIERSSLNDLGLLVEFSTEHGAYWILDRMNQTKDPLLNSHLLIFAAEGAAKDKSPARPSFEKPNGTITAAK